MDIINTDFKNYFNFLSDFIFSLLEKDEHLAFTLSGEQSTFVRFNNAKVRQTGSVGQVDVSFIMWKNKRTFSVSLTLQKDKETDKELLKNALLDARKQCTLLPVDLYQAIPTTNVTSESIFDGKLLEEDEILSTILTPVLNLDFTGLFSQGSIFRASSNSAGARHWFETKSFVLDFSIWLKNGRAVKSCYSGRDWDTEEYNAKIDFAKKSLEALEQGEKPLESGKYRAFISAAALYEFVEFFSWKGLGERGFQQGESAFIALREKRESFSDNITISQDFSLGGEPRFNDMGELAPEKITLIENGKLINTITSSRTAIEYGLQSNGAEDDEEVRSLCIEGGDLDEKDALKALGTGIYVSNFHYLNWSDVQNARITGMTRFSCMWVENGKIVAPIKDMRWDDSLYNLLGNKLEAITKEQHLFSETSTYDRREVGSSLLPGILVSELNCTL